MFSKEDLIEVKKRQGWSDQEITKVWVSRSRCDNCSLCNDVDTGYIKVSSRGSIDADILVVGEAPGYEESKVGLSFIGPAAKHGEAIISSLGIPLDKIRFANATKCFPHEPGKLSPRRPDLHKETAACISYLWDEIEQLKPKVIVSLGAFATSVLLGREISTITGVSGQIKKVVIRGEEYVVIPSPHFSADLRSEGKYRSIIEKTFSLAHELVTDKEIPVNAKIFNTTHEAVGYLRGLLDDYHNGKIEKVAYDIEYDVEVLTNTRSRNQRDEAERMSSLDIFNPKKKIVAASFAVSADEGVCIPLHCAGSNVDVVEVEKALKSVLEEIPVIAHNFVKAEGPWSIQKLGVKPKLFSDTMLMSYVLHMKTCSHGLKSLARKHLGWGDWSRDIDTEIENLPEGARSFKNIPIDVLGIYSAIDPAATWGLYEIFEARIKEEGLCQVNDLMVRTSNAFLDIEQRGAFIDLEFHRKIKEEYPIKREEAFQNILKIPEVIQFSNENGKEFNPNSFEHVGDILYGYFGLDLPPPDKGEPGSLYFSVALAPGDTSMTKTFEFDSDAKVLWVEEKRGERAERLKIKSMEGNTIEFVNPVRYFHSRPISVRIGNPSTKESIIIENIEKTANDPNNLNLHNFLVETRNYKKIGKMLNSYIDPIVEYLVPDTNRIVFNYLIHGTDTGRLTTKNFSLQTLPFKSDIRRLFVSQWKNEGGLILSMDQSQLEMRVMASLSDDEELIKAYLTCVKCDRVADLSEGTKCKVCESKLGDDLHTLTASRVWRKDKKDVTEDERRFAKTISFGIIYGRGAGGISEATGLSYTDSSRLIREYFDQFSGVRRFIDIMHDQYHAHGWVHSPTGRKLYMEGWGSSNPSVVAAGERKSQNYPVQCAGSDLTLEGLLFAKDSLCDAGLRSVPWEFTHDSIEYDVAPGELFNVIPIAKDCMQRKVLDKYPWMKVPLITSCEIGCRWDGSVDVLDIDASSITLEGKTFFFNETVEHLRLCYNVDIEVLDEWEKKEDNKMMARRSYEGDNGGNSFIKAKVLVS